MAPETRDVAKRASRKAVVTGSSSGIGRAIALELARDGCNVLIHAGRSKQAAHNVADEVRHLGRESDVCLADLAEESGREHLLGVARDWSAGSMDVWVNNAGVDVLTGEAAAWSFERKLRTLWSVDVEATIHLARSVGQEMKTAGSGAIINIGWDQAVQGMAGDSGELFATTKGAVMAFTKSLAQSLAPTVRVNCVAPGWIRTSWGEQASDFWQRRAVAESQLGRWGTPEDIARVVRFLASEEASYMTGQIVAVNGGFRSATLAAETDHDETSAVDDDPRT